MLQRAAFRCVAQFFRLALLAGHPALLPATGKRSDPAWENIPPLKQKQVKRAVRHLEGEGKDISFLTAELLTHWLSQHG
jgi:hypothetical protein